MRNTTRTIDLYEQVKQNTLDRAIKNIVEKLGANADMGDYIDDFAKSDAPQFKGASDEKRREMAIAAFLDQKDKKEGFASDAQRRAAFAQGYKAKGKKDKDKKEEFVKEDGHTDVASAVRQCKTVTEDAMQMLQKLQTMSPEDALPSWWTNKLAVASNSMNKMRDYLLVPSVSEEVELDEAIPKSTMYGVVVKGKYIAKGSKQDMLKLAKKTGGELMNAPGKKVGDSAGKAEEVGEELDKDDEGTVKKIIGKLKKASQAHAGQAKQLTKDLQDNFTPSMIAKLKKTYEPLKGKKINPNPLMKIFDKIDSNKNGLIQLYKADIPFVSTMAMSRLTLKHDMKADQIKKLKEEVDPVKSAQNKLKIAKIKQDAKDDVKRIKSSEEVELDEQFDYVLLDKDNKIVARASGKNAKKDMESSKKSAHLPPMRIPKGEVSKMKVYPISPKDKKDIGDMVLAIGEEKNHIKEMIESGKFTRTEIKKMIERNILEQKSATGYTLFHKSFSDAMQHAYAHAKKKMGMTVDPKEIDSKVATGPKKPSEGKTNKYSLKTNKGMLQIQVYNKGGSKPFELNMYSS